MYVFPQLKKKKNEEKRPIIPQNRNSIIIHRNNHKNAVSNHLLLWYNALHPKATLKVAVLQTRRPQDNVGPHWAARPPVLMTNSPRVKANVPTFEKTVRQVILI